ncbi:GrpB family protein [Nonomuraea sp. PA05]|uniref:GrpB family protein n=1 Tax=Nonomuraea sp. PA05 TaxID=2604466 RepID=UPI0011D31E0B|nr:GrpB family protein [Nonomuraea sp. PA05]TYB64417.1 GrpB family protein [Nonomuraea sp. PA05]
MPFPDEPALVAVVDYRPQWPADFDRLATTLQDALGDQARAIDHVGSTSVPGLAAKDCVDVQVRVDAIEEDRLVALLAAAGFRCRPEPWNRVEVSFGQECRKLVFAPPVGARRCNVHVREMGGQNARFALLFRDYLRADEVARLAWGAFKKRLALSVPDLLDNGQVKAPATAVLMRAAERWAAETGWRPAPGHVA